MAKVRPFNLFLRLANLFVRLAEIKKKLRPSTKNNFKIWPASKKKSLTTPVL